MLKTRCLARRRITAPFSLERISSGARSRLKPRAEEKPWWGDERRERRWVRISEVVERRRMRALEIQKIVRIVLSVSGEVVSRPDVGDANRSRMVGSDDGGRILLTIRATWWRIATRTEGMSSMSARRTSSLR